MHASKRRFGAVAVVLVTVVALTGCLRADVKNLSSDALNGRQDGSAGSAVARDLILGYLREWTVGPNTAGTGDAAYTVEAGLSGTSLVGIIPGTDLADEYVVVGAHYDGLGTSCTGTGATDSICNGATDNATSVAILLDIIRSYAESGTQPRRSIVFGFWDRGEDRDQFFGAWTGSNYWASNQTWVPLAQTVAYVNFDIQGANLRPGVANSTFAIGAETGGSLLTDAVTAAAAPGTLDTYQLSVVFGLDSSDHTSFYKKNVPTVFFTDTWGPCHHTVDDETEVVDFAKLEQQAQTGRRLVADLADRDDTATFAATRPLVTFQDAVNVQTLFHQVDADLQSLSPTMYSNFLGYLATVDALVAAGPGAFDASDGIALLQAVSPVATLMLPSGPCDGFLPAP